MSRLTEIMAALGAFGTDTPRGNGRPIYPYPVGQRHERTGRQPQHCKKGPGRRHVQGRQK